MTTPTGATHVRARTRAVVEHHDNEAKPGKPVRLLLAGGLTAAAALGLIVYVVSRVWLAEDLDTSQGLTFLGMLAPIYLAGIFFFSYGYELYDVKRAARLTAIIVLGTLVFVIILAVVFVVIAGSSSKKSDSSRSGSSSEQPPSPALASIPGNASSESYAAQPPSVPSTPRGRDDHVLEALLLGSSSRGTTAPGPVEPATTQVLCPACQQGYEATGVERFCPNCGVARES